MKIKLFRILFFLGMSFLLSNYLGLSLGKLGNKFISKI